jgi:hypothetical protein
MRLDAAARAVRMRVRRQQLHDPEAPVWALDLKDVDKPVSNLFAGSQCWRAAGPTDAVRSEI